MVEAVPYRGKDFAHRELTKGNLVRASLWPILGNPTKIEKLKKTHCFRVSQSLLERDEHRPFVQFCIQSIALSMFKKLYIGREGCVCMCMRFDT